MEVNNKFVEHRRSRRRLIFIHASIVHPLQTEHLSCTLHDISEDGALIDFEHAMDLPASFWLRLDGEPVLRFCKVAWRSTFELGVAFKRRIVERRRSERLVNTHVERNLLGEVERKNYSQINNLFPIR